LEGLCLLWGSMYIVVVVVGGDSGFVPYFLMGSGSLAVPYITTETEVIQMER